MKTTTRAPEEGLKTISLTHLLAHQFPPCGKTLSRRGSGRVKALNRAGGRR